MSSGFVVGWKRLTTFPSRSIRNLVKFHSMSPGASAPLSPCLARRLRRPAMSASGASSLGRAFLRNAKIEVNGAGAEPLYQFLKATRPKDDAPEADIVGLRELLAKHGLTGAEAPGDIEWNFTKFLIDRDGKVVKRFHPTTPPEAIAREIEPLLN